MKTQITNISSVGIIFRASNPAEILMEIKDDSHPIKLVRHQLCFIGGNWIGEGAKGDINTFGTFKRELYEELSFDRLARDSVELNFLGQADIEQFAPIPQPAAEILPEDRESLSDLKRVIIDSAMPFGDFLNTVEKAALDAADPANKRDGFTDLSSYWVIALQENTWKNLLRLQMKFKNLSNESCTIITSLEEIIRTDTKTAFAHDRVLKRFFLQHGLALANDLPLVPNVQSREAGMPLPTYKDYLEQYEVAKRPV